MVSSAKISPVGNNRSLERPPVVCFVGTHVVRVFLVHRAYHQRYILDGVTGSGGLGVDFVELVETDARIGQNLGECIDG